MLNENACTAPETQKLLKFLTALVEKTDEDDETEDSLDVQLSAT